MINYLAGQPLAKKFVTLVCTNGVFSMPNLLSGDVAYSVPRDLGGDLWTDPTKWDRFDPSRFTQNWTQPMLIIHSDKDYRIPISEGLAVFNVCQMRGIESRFLNFPDEGHFVLGMENSLHWYRTMLGWCNKFVDNKEGVNLSAPASESLT
jgi:dipeptidyl aminopeptidase/acylaminoacyl peptidase